MHSWLAKLARHVRPTSQQRHGKTRRKAAPRSVPTMELLETRLAPAVSVTAFNPTQGTITIAGDGANDTLILSEVPDGQGHAVLAYDIGEGNPVTSFPVTGGGNSTFVIGSGTSPQITLDLGAGTNSLTLDSTWSFTTPVSFTGTGGTNSLIGPDSASPNTWALTGNDAGNVNGGKVTFSNVQTLTAGPAQQDLLYGENGVSGTWTLTGGTTTQTYNDGTSPVTFSNMAEAHAGAHGDTFNLTDDGSGQGLAMDVYGGSGNDTFNVSNNVSLTADIIDGGAGTDTVDFSNYSSLVTVKLGSVDATGFRASENSSGALFRGIDKFVGSNAAGVKNQLNGLNVASTWALGSTQTYTDNNSHTLTFSGFQVLQGGNGGNTFNVTVAAATTTLKGGTGTDTLAMYGDVTLTASAANGFTGSNANLAGFSGIDTLTGHGSPLPTLNGENVASTWTLGSTQKYSDGSHNLTFSGYSTLQGGSAANTFNVNTNTTANLKGGAGNDSFIFADGKTLTGTIDGGAGSDTLDLSASTSALSVALTGSGANGFAGSDGVTSGFSGIDTILAGSNGGDTLTGRNVASTWSLGSSQTYADGTATLTFANFETLQAGSAGDAFNVTANTTANLDGGAGNDSFTLSPGVTLTGSIDAHGGNDTLSVPGAVQLNASDSTEGFLGVNANITGTFRGINTLIGSGSDTLTGENDVSTWTLSLPSASTYTSSFNTLTFSGYTTLHGRSGTDKLIGENVASTWSLGASQTYTDGTYTVTFSGFVALQGGSAADAFNVTAATTATIDGGAGTDTLNVSGAVTLTGSAANGFAGSNANVGGFADIDVLTGGGSDALTGENVASTWTLALPASSTYNDGGHTLTFSGYTTLHGGTAADSLQGENVASTWSLGASQTYTDGTYTVTFSGFEALLGGSAADTFNVTAATTATVSGGAGTDTLSVSGDVALTGSTANGFGGSNANVGGFSGIDVLTGGGTTPTLTGENVASTWALGGSQTYSEGGHTLTFSGYATLQGGSAADTFNVTANTTANLKGGAGNDSFVFADGKTLTGTIDGQGGSDTLDLSASTSALSVALTASDATNGFAGTDGVTSGFSGIDTILAGSNGGDTLTGRNVASTWALGSPQTYSDGTATLTFANFETLQAGSAGDAFNVTANTAANLKGGAGADTFTLSAGVTLTGSIDGGAGSDTLSVAGAAALTGSGAHGFAGTNAHVTGNFSNIDVLAGGGSDALTGENVASTWTLSALLAANTYNDGSNTLTFTGYTTLDGGTASDTLVGENVASTWSLGNTQTYQDGSNTVTFSGFEALQGGTAADTFNVTVPVTETLSGGAGTDTLSVSGAVTLTGSDGTGFGGSNANVGGFSGIDVLTGSGTLTGENVNSTWSLGSTQTYGDGGHTLTFSGYATLQGGSAADTFNVTANISENLNGGAGNDSFVFADGKSVIGDVDGQGGSDTLDLSASTSALSVALTASDATNGFAGTYGVSSSFSGIDKVLAGSNGGDVLTGENVASTWSLGSSQTYNDGTATLAFANFETLQGGSAVDTFNISANTTANLKGGTTGSDVFAFTANNVVLTGSIDGQGGAANELEYPGYTSAVSVNLYVHTATGLTQGFSNVQVFAGGSGSNTLTGPLATNTWDVTGSNAGTLNTGSSTYTFSGFGNLTGGAGADTFVFSDGAGVTGTVNGGAGNDKMDFSHYASNHAVTFKVGTDTNDNLTANNGGSVSAGGVSFNFVSVENLTGGAGADTFGMTPGRSLSGNLVGGGTATLDYSAFTSSVRANLMTGKVVGVGGSVSGVLNIIGGQGDDILIGNGQGNTLTGGGGNDVLVANGGNATLNASAGGQSILIGGNHTGTAGATLNGSASGSDLLIAGSTMWDNNITALNALIAEWGDASEDAATRIAHITGAQSGGRNGSSFVLNASTVNTSNNHNTVHNGAAAVDLIFVGLGDTLDNQSGGNSTVIYL